MFSRLLEQIAAALEAAGFEYMVVGGQAVLVYGEPRMTKDIDVTVGAGLERLHELRAAAARIGLRPLVDDESFTRETMVFPCQDPDSGIRVDFILSTSDYERLALSRVRRVPVGNASVRFASLEDVVVHKVIAGRPRDLEDVRKLLLKNPGVDATYVEGWLERFSKALSQPFSERFQELRRETSK